MDHSRSSPDLSLVVRELRSVADGVLVVSLSCTSDSELPAWEAGAHIDLELTPTILRQYSLCGDVDDRHTWQIAVRLDEEGRGGSAFVHKQLREGAVVRASLPRNHFPLGTKDTHLMIAGGIGITPILPMVHQLEREGRSWHLWYVGRSRGSMAFLDELSAYGDHVTIIASDEGRRLDLERLLESPRTAAAVYCCGPKRMVQAVQSSCANWPAGSLHVEHFTPAAPDPAAGQAFELHLQRSGLTLQVPGDKSILEVLEAAGVNIPFSCREGLCGSCETFVIEGKPEHRDSVLSEAEHHSDESLMPCVSRSVSSRLVLDL